MNTDFNGEKNGESSDWHDAATGRFKRNNPGRQPGSKNKLRDTIRKFIDEQWESFPQWFGSLKPKEKIEVVLDLMPYAVARLQSISMTDSEGNDLPRGATIDYTKLSEATLKEILNATTTNENGSH